MTPEVLKNPNQQRLVELDEEVDGLKRELDEAAASLPHALNEVSSRPEVDGSIPKRLLVVANRLKDLQPRMKDLDFDSEQQAALWASILEVDQALRSTQDDLDRFEQMLLGVERVRQVIRDALDEFTGGDEANRGELVRHLRTQLPGVTQERIAELLGVSSKTFRRWTTESGAPNHRLSLVTKLVQILHHAWTPDGVIAWFEKPRQRLDGRAPIDVLDDPGIERELVSEARGGRNQYAS